MCIGLFEAQVRIALASKEVCIKHKFSEVSLKEFIKEVEAQF